jgi:hypothetical protein
MSTASRRITTELTTVSVSHLETRHVVFPTLTPVYLPGPGDDVHGCFYPPLAGRLACLQLRYSLVQRGSNPQPTWENRIGDKTSEADQLGSTAERP